MKHKNLDGLIDLVYDAATDPGQWPVVLRTVSDALGGCGFVMSMLPVNKVVTSPFVTGVRVDPDHLNLIRLRYSSPDTNPLVAAMPHLPVASPVVRECIQEDAEYFRGELYNEVFRPLGLAHTAVACLHRTPEHIVPMGILKRSHCNRPDSHDLRLLGRLLPHMHRSAQLYLRVAGRVAQTNTMERVLHEMPFGVILVDAEGRVLFRNRGAEAITGVADGLTVRNGLLKAMKSDETKTLHRLIEDAALIAGGQGGCAADRAWVTVSRTSRRRPYSVLVLPVPRRAEGFAGELCRTGPVALVLVTDPDATPDLSIDAMRRLYDLTPAEIRLAGALVSGKTLGEYAAQAGVTRETARWRLKQVLAKTDTHRQSELVRLLLASCAHG